jgi:hypothetical protein
MSLIRLSYNFDRDKHKKFHLLLYDNSMDYDKLMSGSNQFIYGNVSI